MDVQSNTMTNTMSKVVAIACLDDNITRDFVKVAET